jgi:hypothetical protein
MAKKANAVEPKPRTIEDVIRDSLKDWTGPTVVIKGVERPDHTVDQEEAAVQRKAWEDAHREA